MRTTLTLDDDVAAKLKAQAAKSGRSIQDIVNESLRIALSNPQPTKTAKPFKVKAFDLRLRPGLSYDNIEELLDRAEGPLRR